MDPSRKRTIRFVVALSAAVLLAGALAYTSFSASTEARQPSELAAVPTPGRQDLPARRQGGPGLHAEGRHDVLPRPRPRRHGTPCPVTYAGRLPDPFRADREVVVDVVKGDVYVGQKGSLVTKCPSKFTADQTQT